MCIISDIVEVFLCALCVTTDNVSNLSCALLGCKNLSSRSSCGFNMVNNSNQLINIKRTSLLIRCVKTSQSINGCLINSFVDFLRERPTNPVDNVIEINTTRKDSVKLFINLNGIQLHRRYDNLITSKSLSADTLCSLCNLRNHIKLRVITNIKLHAVAKSNVSKLREIIQRRVLWQTRKSRLCDNLFDDREHFWMATHSTIIQFCRATIKFDKGFTKCFLCFSNRIISLRLSVVRIYRKFYNVISISHCVFPPIF